MLSEFDTLIDGIIVLIQTSQDPYLPLSKDPRDVAVERFERFQNFLEGYKGRSNQCNYDALVKRILIVEIPV